ncbi:MAG: hypothetical protein GY801_18495, partial [bacterium]|nr:hypothetical protein [bacterium]
LVKLERRSLQDVLGRLSKEERLELGRIFAGADGAQTRMNIYRKRGHTSRLRMVLHFLLLNLALGLLLLFVHALGVWFFLPDKQEIKEIAQLVQMHLKKTETGELEFGGAINDLYASGEQISPHVKEALVAREDKRFYAHLGLDWRGKGRAVIKSLTGRLQGGSTLTEQLAKNLFLSGARGLFSGIRRKFKERVLAFKLEAYYSKNEILEMYLNRVYFGRGAYGIETAARLFFNIQPEELDELDLYQSAMLVQSLPAPNAFNCSRKPERAAKETRKLLEQMEQTVDEDYLSYTAERCHNNGKRTVIKPEHRYLRDWIASELKNSDYFDELEGNFVVVTTMNARMQNFAKDAIADVMRKYVDRGIFHPSRLPQASMVALTPQGAVRAIMGGRDYGESQFSRVTQAERQPGSTFKLFVYLAALEQGIATISDQPDDKGWPSNGRHGYSPGPIALTDALKQSLNAAAVNALSEVGIEKVIDRAENLGVTPNFPIEPGLSLALGAYEVTPLEMTGAYTVFANGGRAVEPHGILFARTASGSIRHKQQDTRRRVVKKKIVTKMNDMLTAVVEDGTGKRAQFGDHIVGGKTGTTQGNSDAWFIGCTAYLCTGVWVGYDTSSQRMPRSVYGGSLPAEIFKNFMDKTHQVMQWSPKELP